MGTHRYFGRKTKTLAERFWAKVAIAGPDECWEWTAAKQGAGYGWFYPGDHRTGMGAHRIAWILEHGSIEAKLHIDHLCRNHLCVNVRHMEAVTPQENSRRGFSPMAINARKTHCLRGHPYDEANTHWRERPHGRACRACARENARRYKVERLAHQKTISDSAVSPSGVGPTSTYGESLSRRWTM